MRSSIACIRCRRSKVKCVNNGVGTTCRSCENSGRNCEYPPPVAAGSRRGEGSISKVESYTDGSERRPRPRKSAATFAGAGGHGGSRESPRPMLDALDPGLLTPTVWSELFDIFQTHYSADLPFLHPPTFLKPLRQATMQPPGRSLASADAATVRPPGPEDFLLAFLALTARFHPRIVAHHSPPTSSRPSNPLIASEYYANAANERQLATWPGSEVHTTRIEGIQAALMLGLHEWGMCRGYKAWIRVGLATRSAQAMGLQYESELDDEPNSRSMALNFEAERMGLGNNRNTSFSAATGEESAFIEQEIRRRTFWSCYVMDRYLSSGKYRPQMLHARELRIQLPASERSFLFAEKVRTLMLGEQDRNGTGRAEVQSHRHAALGFADHTAVPSPKSMNDRDGDDEKGRLEVGADEGLVSRYIKILEIYGKVVQWSCAGGRRVESYPPWDPRSEFDKLLKMCHDFRASLPRQHTLSHQNTQAHITLKTQTPYTLVHTVYLLCQIMLHREYVPFIPLRCNKPEGPLDPPLFPPDKYTVPEGFWESSARECFKSARDIMDLVRTCQEWNALVETPIVGFAIYTVAFDGVYCINFPWMDPDGYMCTQPSAAANQSGQSKGFETARKSLEMIGQMRPRLHMADGWFKTINRMHRYFRRMKSDYKKNVQANESGASESEGSPLSSRHLSLREGGIGGGLDEFKLLERTLKEFGNLEDQDIEMTDGRSTSRLLDALYDDSNSGGTVKSEEGDRMPTNEQPQKHEGPWNAINAGPDATRQAPLPAPSPSTNGQFRSYESYQAPVSAAAPAHHAQMTPNYPQTHLNGFRPASYPHPHDGSAPPSGAPPSLNSPTSRTASTPSQPSPSFDRQQSHSYSAWAQQQSAYGMPLAPHHQQQPQHHQPYPPHPHPHPPTPLSAIHGYPTPGAQPQHGPPGPMLPPPPQHSQHHYHDPAEQQQMYDPATKDAWLNSVNTGLGGDDVAAFVDGSEMSEWASMSARSAYGGGWLNTVWSGNPGIN